MALQGGDPPDEDRPPGVPRAVGRRRVRTPTDHGPDLGPTDPTPIEGVGVPTYIPSDRAVRLAFGVTHTQTEEETNDMTDDTDDMNDDTDATGGTDEAT